jgi:hypothetical protein
LFDPRQEAKEKLRDLALGVRPSDRERAGAKLLHLIPRLRLTEPRFRQE